MSERVAILDAGAQYGKVIDRKVRELAVESTILPLDTPAAEIVKNYKAIIISGGPGSVSSSSASQVDPDIFQLSIPILGICYGMQLINKTFGGVVERAEFREDGQCCVELNTSCPLFKDLSNKETVLLTHGDKCTKVADGFMVTGTCEQAITAIANEPKNIYGVQFHPEVDLTLSGMKILRNFLLHICSLSARYLLPNRMEKCIEYIKQTVEYPKKVLVLLSGGVDSTVCAALLARALKPEQIIALHIDNGFMRLGESSSVVEALKRLDIKVHLVNAALDFFSGCTTQLVTVETQTSGASAQQRPSSVSDETPPPPSKIPGLYVETRKIPIGPLNGRVVCPEQKRRIIGDTFVRIANQKWLELELDPASLILCQGTLRPDLIESASHSASQRADLIKTHHNTTELVMKLKRQGQVIEPLADFHKDEVRQIGRELNLPEEIVNRHPFPGPGLAIRVLCAAEAYVDRDFLETTSMIKMIAGYHTMSQKPHALLSKIKSALSSSEQAKLMEVTTNKNLAAHLLPVRSVGVQGDHRTYSYACALSTVVAPEWNSLLFLAKIIPRICHNINRVVYVFGDQVAHPVNDVTVTFLRQPVVETLRQVDSSVNAVLHESGYHDKVSQMPVILIPVHFDRDPTQCMATPSILRSVVMRPFVTSDFMTGLPAIPGTDIPEAVVFKMKEAALQEPERRSRRSILAEKPEQKVPKPVDSAQESVVKKPRKSIVKPQKEFELEINRLTSCSAQYRSQPVCPICEVYSSDDGAMFQCAGKCGRFFHPSCIPNDAAKADEKNNSMCTECSSGQYNCRVCNKKASEEAPLFECLMSQCGRFYHRTCVEQHPCSKIEQSGDKFGITQCPAHSCSTCKFEAMSLEDNDGQPITSAETLLLHCVRCANAYHTQDLCTPAGSVEVSLSDIVCPVHFEGALSKKAHYKTERSPFCFTCCKGGGDRVYCQSCPSSYHTDCLNALDPKTYQRKDGAFVCTNCVLQVQPRYGQVVWAKMQGFRWWPCEVMHARNAPINILQMGHPEGAFPIHVLDADEYQWICRSRVLPYELGVRFKPLIAASSARFEKQFRVSVNAAPRIHEIYVNHLRRKGLPLKADFAKKLTNEEFNAKLSQSGRSKEDNDEKSSSPHAYETITENCMSDDAFIFLRSKHAKEELMPTCSKDESCKCSVCLGKKLAGLQEFSFEVFSTVNRGLGLKACVQLEEQSVVLEFVGEVVTVEEANSRLNDELVRLKGKGRSLENSGGETMIMRMTESLAIDASTSGNLSRFINHSCRPNLEAFVCSVGGKPRMAIVTLRPIEKGEELTLDYKRSQFLCSTMLFNKSIVCLCGAENCLQLIKFPHCFNKIAHATKAHREEHAILKSPVSAASLEKTETDVKIKFERNGKKSRKSVVEERHGAAEPVKKGRKSEVAEKLESPEPVKKQRKSKVEVKGEASDTPAKVAIAPGSRKNSDNYDDFCYRCGDGGDLMLCDKKLCLKAYHVQCLGLSKTPSGCWHCPWHYCDSCGAPATRFCWRCPNSFCSEHADVGKCMKIDGVDQEVLEKNAITNLVEACSEAKQETLLNNLRWICSDHDSVHLTGSEKHPLISPLQEITGKNNIAGLPRQSKKRNSTPPTKDGQKREKLTVERIS